MYFVSGGTANYVWIPYALSPDTEYALVCTLSETESATYVAGTSYSEAIIEPTAPFAGVSILGAGNANYGHRSDMYEMKIWNRALTASEAAEVQAGKPVDAELLFDSDMSPWSGTIIHDQSGNQNHISIPSGSS